MDKEDIIGILMLIVLSPLIILFSFIERPLRRIHERREAYRISVWDKRYSYNDEYKEYLKLRENEADRR